MSKPTTPSLYVIETRLAKEQSDLDAHLEVHLAHQDDLERSGILLAAGPFLKDDDTPGGDGLIVVRADSRDAAERIAQSDPLHQAGIRTYTVRRWQVNEGHLSIKVDLSAQSARLT